MVNNEDKIIWSVLQTEEEEFCPFFLNILIFCMRFSKKIDQLKKFCYHFSFPYTNTYNIYRIKYDFYKRKRKFNCNLQDGKVMKIMRQNY